MAKRSPILGYNHNVRYRGLVFHVQTEDSGVLSPHLFTHLFHEGVIVSTRKLVYDAGASEAAIKALMQAQHKAVLKDLKIHTFDDKIDAYLGNAPGLEPRGGPPTPDPNLRVSEPVIEIVPERSGTEPGEPLMEEIELAPEAPEASSTDLAADEASPVKPRTQTAERTSRASQFRSIAPPEPSSPEAPPSRPARAATPPPIPQRTVSKTALTVDSSPEIEIINHAESGRERGPRDTAVDHMIEDGVPSMIIPDTTIPSDQMPRTEARPGTASRPPSHNAAALLAVRPPSRPAVTPPSVVSRPVQDPARGREDSQAVEIYSPSPPSVEPPPGERSERPGQYSMNRRKDVVVSTEQVPLRDRTGRTAIPSGLARPRSANPAPISGRTGAPSSPPSVPAPAGRSTAAAPPAAPAASSDGVPQVASDARAPSHPSARTPHLTAPIASRTSTGSGGAAPHNVVMTRPAVIVGAPPKQVSGPTPRVRKAREDEGRGFGQGLISEKSLDEVILAYLSEDADEK
ncbi:MAG: hypothetical protein ABI467_04725 [Kofleriaceae bacterium]